jgi:hypothetical protein
MLGMLFLASGMSSATASTGTFVPNGKVDVCKYVGTPGPDERLQTGQNPIEVNANSINNAQHDPPQVGDFFADAQGRSVVIAVAGDPEPTVIDCPGYVPPVDPPTTTVTVTATPSVVTSTVTAPPIVETTTVTVTPEPVTSTVTVPADPSTVTVPVVETTTVTATPSTVTVIPAPVTETVTSTVTATETQTATATQTATETATATETETDIVEVPVTVSLSGTVTKTTTGSATSTTVVRSKAQPGGNTPLASTGVSAGKQIIFGLALLLLGAILAFGPGIQRRVAKNRQH